MGTCSSGPLTFTPITNASWAGTVETVSLQARLALTSTIQISHSYSFIGLIKITNSINS